MKRFAFLSVFLGLVAVVFGAPSAQALPTGASLGPALATGAGLSTARYHSRRYVRGRGPARHNRRIDYCSKFPRRCG